MTLKQIIYLLKGCFFFTLWGPLIAGLCVAIIFLIMPHSLSPRDFSAESFTLLIMGPYFFWVLMFFGAIICFIVGIVASSFILLGCRFLGYFIACEASMVITTIAMYSALGISGAALHAILIFLIPTAVCATLFWRRN